EWVRLVALAPDLVVDRSRVDERHVDARAAQVIPEPLAEAVQRALGRGVERLVRRHHLGGERGDVHDRPALLAQHHRDRGERGPETREEVDADRLLPLLYARSLT